MKARYWLGILLACGAVLGAVAFALARRGGQASDAEQPVQWPFDSGELSDLTDRVIAEQRELVADAPTPAARERAQAFLDYYEQRRAAQTAR
jgi:hypothetical protein